MKIQVIAIILTVVNLALLIFLLLRVGPATQDEVATVLRGKGLEIIDDNGKMRAQITVIPASTNPDGQVYQDPRGRRHHQWV